MRKFSKHILCAALLLCPLAAMAQSFTYNYCGIEFKCKIKNGKVHIIDFETNASDVIIPAKVENIKTRKEYKVSVIDLYHEVRNYKANKVEIQEGVQEIEDLCFQNFRQLGRIIIPYSIDKIGKKAFNAKYMPNFEMPSIINKNELIAGHSVNVAIEKARRETPNPTPTPVPIPNPTPITLNPDPVTPGTSDIDFNIPTVSVNRENTFCIIIANENYQKQNTPDVAYAAIDGQTFKQYCNNTLGIPNENIDIKINATYLEMDDMFNWLKSVAEDYGNDANYIVYYAGHGVPDTLGNCYLLPVDGDINKPGNGYSLKELYSTLGKITTKSALVLIDACFSGTDRNDVSIVDGTGRGFVREIKSEAVTGNVVVLTAASNTETALSYKEKGHGMFSYFLMQKLQETKGNVTYGELFDHINKMVRRRSNVIMKKRQTPSVTYSDNIRDTWRNMKF